MDVTSQKLPSQRTQEGHREGALVDGERGFSVLAVGGEMVGKGTGLVDGRGSSWDLVQVEGPIPQLHPGELDIVPNLSVAQQSRFEHESNSEELLSPASGGAPRLMVSPVFRLTIPSTVIHVHSIAGLILGRVSASSAAQRCLGPTVGTLGSQGG